MNGLRDLNPSVKDSIIEILEAWEGDASKDSLIELIGEEKAKRIIEQLKV